MPIDIQNAWNRAQLVEPFEITTPNTKAKLGTFVCESEAIQIFSLEPKKVFTDLHPTAWAMVFRIDDTIVGMSEYFTALKQLKPYIMDIQDGNALIRAMSPEELQQVLAAAESIVASKLA